MSAAAQIAAHGAVASSGLTDADLAQLMRSFNEATTKLADTHETLRAEVARLERELSATRDQLRRARQLAALGEMAAGIAHEIRNPLGSIKLYAKVLEEDLADRPEPCATARKVSTAVDRLNAVVGDVLTFARELKLRKVAIDPHELMNDAIDACADLWAARNLTLHPPHKRPRKPSQMCAAQAHVRCDPNLLHQALVNVLRNAAQALSEPDERAKAPARGGDIWLDVERRTAMREDGTSRQMVALIVRDSGPGIPPDAVDRLFNPFFTTRASGTGLGLAIVHRIIDAHGGRVILRNHASQQTRIRARGVPLTGTTVELQIPAHEETDNTKPEVQS